MKGAPQSPIVSVLGSCCLGKSPKLGEVLSCYSLWRSGANPVTSVYGHRGAKGLLPMEVPRSLQANPATSINTFLTLCSAQAQVRVCTSKLTEYTLSLTVSEFLPLNNNYIQSPTSVECILGGQ